MINFENWTSRRWENTWGSFAITAVIDWREGGTVLQMAYARVETNDMMLFLVWSERQKKNVANRRFWSSHHSEMEWAIAVLPAPAAPWSHKIRGGWSSVIEFLELRLNWHQIRMLT